MTRKRKHRAQTAEVPILATFLTRAGYTLVQATAVADVLDQSGHPSCGSDELFTALEKLLQSAQASGYRAGRLDAGCIFCQPEVFGDVFSPSSDPGE